MLVAAINHKTKMIFEPHAKEECPSPTGEVGIAKGPKPCEVPGFGEQ